MRGCSHAVLAMTLVALLTLVESSRIGNQTARCPTHFDDVPLAPDLETRCPGRKTALLLTGELRTGRPDAWREWGLLRQRIAEPLAADVFVAVWAPVGTSELLEHALSSERTGRVVIWANEFSTATELVQETHSCYPSCFDTTDSEYGSEARDVASLFLVRKAWTLLTSKLVANSTSPYDLVRTAALAAANR